MIKKAVLPAAGLGTRFLPATKASPKEMLPIVDKPMIQYSVEEAKGCGINDFIVITGKNKRAIEDHFDFAPELVEYLKQKGNGDLLDEIDKMKGLSFAYIRQGKPLGLGHAILCAKPFLNNASFAVLLGDDIIDPDDKLLYEMIQVHNETKAPVVALQEVAQAEVSRYGIIDGNLVKGNTYEIKSLVEKPPTDKAPSNLAVIGRYILSPDIMDILADMQPGAGGEYQLTDALNILLSERKIYGYLFKGKRYDAGDKLGFLKATIDLALKRPEFSAGLLEYIRMISNRL
ncbi:MAG: UTP--glucose-1-phosphate uridylyltransferase GalU [Candidatus Magnetoovum sp. WYHC-5]|nr:UTP--glucose-1-phosphate uridylyltransferase GalU [Candidatus Magnetoovum sp. WYHC-5]